MPPLVLVFMMVQAMVFGTGAVLVLATPLSDYAMQLFPWVVGLSVVISVPLSWQLAPLFIVRLSRSRATSPAPINRQAASAR